MFDSPSVLLESFRVTRGALGSTPAYGNNGAFFLPGVTRHKLFVIASDQDGWEHVSVSVIKQERTPTWDEMCYVKDLFWREDEAVVQFHPPKSDYVNFHAYTLHLWRPVGGGLTLPPSYLVGPRSIDEAMRAARRFLELG